MKSFLLILSAVIITGCGGSADKSVEQTKALNNNNPMIKKVPKTDNKKVKKTIKPVQISQKERLEKLNKESKLQMAKLQAQKEQNLAQIKAKNEQKLKELELEKTKEIKEQETKQKQIEANNSIELAKINSQKMVEVKEKEIGLYKLLTVAALFVAFAWLIILYLRHLAKQKHEAALKEQEYNFKAHIKETELKHENIGKMLEIISSEKSDPAVKKEITKILSYNKGNLIEHRK